MKHQSKKVIHKLNSPALLFRVIWVGVIAGIVFALLGQSTASLVIGQILNVFLLLIVWIRFISMQHRQRSARYKSMERTETLNALIQQLRQKEELLLIQWQIINQSHPKSADLNLKN